MKQRLSLILWMLIGLSLIPASILLMQRIQIEGRERTVTFLMDERALATQAEYFGMSSFELGEHYKTLGLNGIVFYEETLSSLASKGDIVLSSGAVFLQEALLEQEPLPTSIPTDNMLVTEIKADALSTVLQKHDPAPEALTYQGRTWYMYQGTNSNRPAGPGQADIKQWYEAGWDIAYRPRNYPNLQKVGFDYPEEANYLIYHGLQVAGNPNALSDVVEVSQNYLTGIIEGTPQEGMQALTNKIPTVRILSFNQDYINQRLSPQDLVDKYLLAANERGIRIMYLRPYIQELQGDMLKNTETFIKLLRANFEAEGYKIGALPTLELDYTPNPILRGLSAIGAIAALVLLSFIYPGIWGAAVALFTLVVCFLFGGLDWDTLALAASLCFPVLGYAYFSKHLTSLGLATLISLVGVVLLSAIGSDRESILAIRPFAGVGLTLIAPPALFLFHYALKYRRPAQWVTDFWSTPIQLGHIIIFLFGMAALGLIILRRGNFPIIGASEAELALRQWLSDLFVRPRFKELIGHTLATVGLTNNSWPEWIRALFLTGGVIAQATIMNSFAHYHTPFVISLQRTIIALIIGLIIGLVLVPIIRLASSLIRRWLSSSRQMENARAV